MLPKDEFSDKTPDNMKPFPSLNEVWPLEQGFGNFGTYDTYIRQVLGKWVDFFKAAGVSIASVAVFFKDEDYEGSNAGGQARHAALNKNGQPKDGWETCVPGGMCEELLEMVRKTIHTLPIFHTEKAMEEAFHYNIFDSNNFSAAWLTDVGEGGKFGAKAEAASSTTKSKLERMKTTQLRMLMKDLAGEGEKITIDHADGSARPLNNATKASLVLAICTNMKKAEEEAEEEEEENLGGGGDGDSDGDKGMKEGGEGDDEKGAEGIDEVAELDPAKLLQKVSESRVLELVARLPKEKTLEAKLDVYKEINEIFDRTDWSADVVDLPEITKIGKRVRAFVKSPKGGKEHEDAISASAKKVKMYTGSDTINYTRLKSRSRQLWEGFKLVRKDAIELVKQDPRFAAFVQLPEDEFLSKVCESHPGLCNFLIYFDVGLGTSVGSFVKWADGDPREVMDRLYLMALWLAYYEKPNILLSLLQFIDQCLHFSREERNADT